jgi:hypothetical protein
MRPGLWFVVPVHGRLDLAAICLRQLRRTCDALDAAGIDATAVLIADAENLDGLAARIGAEMLDFQTIERVNDFVSDKFNDGIMLALDPRFNPHPADYVVPCGSDDWVDHRLFLDLPRHDTVVGFQRTSFVREDGREMVTLTLDYPGGAGIRIYPRELLEPLGYAPADPDRHRGCDTSILANLRRHHGDGLRIEHRHLHDAQIVDWKSPGVQLNTYTSLRRHRRAAATSDPFGVLSEVYPPEAISEMRRHYRGRRRVAA